MGFITDNDLTVQIKAEIKTVLQAGAETSFEMALVFAQSEMESYLRKRSGANVPQIFNAAGDERIPVVVMYMIDMALYHLHSKSTTRVMPALRENRYNAAKLWLEMVAAGDIDPGLPEPPATEQNRLFTGSSETKYSKSW